MMQFEWNWHYSIEEIKIGRDLAGKDCKLFVLMFYYYPEGTEKLQKSVRMAIFRPRI